MATMNVAKKLDMLMTQSGISPGKLAKAIGGIRSEATVRRWRKGEGAGPRLHELEALAKHFDKPITFFREDAADVPDVPIPLKDALWGVFGATHLSFDEACKALLRAERERLLAHNEPGPHTPTQD